MKNDSADVRALAALSLPPDRIDLKAIAASDASPLVRAEAMRRLTESLNRADSALTDLQRITRPLGDRSERISRNADEGLVQLNQILSDVRALLRAVDRSDGTFRKFLTDPSLYNNLDQAACMIAKTMPRLDRILKDFETFADKLARHPEAIGLGGVVRPGSGLKDGPASPPWPVPPGH